MTYSGRYSAIHPCTIPWSRDDHEELYDPAYGPAIPARYWPRGADEWHDPVIEAVELRADIPRRVNQIAAEIRRQDAIARYRKHTNYSAAARRRAPAGLRARIASWKGGQGDGNSRVL